MRFPTNFWFLLFNPVSSKVLHRGFQLFFVRDSFTFTICKFNYGIYTVYQGNQDSHWQEWWVGEFWALLWCRLALSMGPMKGFALERAAKSLWLPREGHQQVTKDVNGTGLPWASAAGLSSAKTDQRNNCWKLLSSPKCEIFP